MIKTIPGTTMAYSEKVKTEAFVLFLKKLQPLSDAVYFQV